MPEPNETRLEPQPADAPRADPRDPGAVADGPLTPRKILWRLALLALLLTGFVWIYFLKGPAVEDAEADAAPSAVTAPESP